ncbi:MAG: HNH endonuclease signature motif containing protein, partial [Ramlibacter sp.]
MTAPSPEQQLSFIAKVQRLFAEGDFTATYKFALLIALADLAVEQAGDDGGPVRLTNRAIAAKFIELYWQQAAPYSSKTGTEPSVLAQNIGEQASIINALVNFRRIRPAATLVTASGQPEYAQLLRVVTATVSAQPLVYMQNLGGQTAPFLYTRVRGAVLLLPGVAYCLRRFQALVQQLARSHWIHHIKKNRLNLPVLGEADDLESFLFETPRATLAVIGAGLRRLDARCFYCRGPVVEADVDHFIPFSMYQKDLAHNFVLAHPACNRSKSDTLAARPHLEQWLEHATRNNDALQEIGQSAGRIANLASSRAVTRWGYSNAITGGGRAWVRASKYETIDERY